MGLVAPLASRALTARLARVALVLVGAVAAVAGAGGCAAPSRAQRVQEAAYELNMGLRFGHNTQALGKVATDHRRDFLRRHREWSQRLRIVDLDLAGLDVRDEGADVFVSVLWQPVDETTVRTTVIHQLWKDQRGTWLLVGEERSQGDSGLIDEVQKKKPTDEGDKKKSSLEGVDPSRP